MDHDADLHESRVDGSAPRIDNVHIVFPDRFTNRNSRLADGAAVDLCLSEGEAYPGMGMQREEGGRMSWNS
jgi:hypothetical protein